MDPGFLLRPFSFCREDFFNSPCDAGPRGVEAFSFLYVPSFVKDIFTGYRILDRHEGHEGGTLRLEGLRESQDVLILEAA